MYIVIKIKLLYMYIVIKIKLLCMYIVSKATCIVIMIKLLRVKGQLRPNGGQAMAWPVATGLSICDYLNTSTHVLEYQSSHWYCLQPPDRNQTGTTNAEYTEACI